MKLQTFQAATMADALAQVKNQLGTQAVILHTRTFKRRHWWGLRQRNVVEITAGHGMNVPSRQVRRPAPVSVAPLDRPVQSLARQTVPAGAPVSVGAGATMVERSRELMQTPAANHAVMIGISQEMTALKTMVNDLLKQHRHQRTPSIPEELLDYYQKLIDNQVAEEIASEVIKTLHRDLRPEMLQQPEYVRQKLADQIEKLIPSSGPINRKKLVGPHVVALIGPTGVGKTTTLAKLGANLKLRERKRVGLITIDTYRIAAVDQLRKYADIIGSPLRAVNTPEDLRTAIADMSDCDYVLVDTTGRSPNDTLKINELKAFLKAAQADEVHLVLSSTSSQACVELAMSRFVEVGVDRVLFTKLDEAAHLGVVLNVIWKLNKSLSYVTAGQDVPDDIEVGTGRRLAQLILGNNL